MSKQGEIVIQIDPGDLYQQQQEAVQIPTEAAFIYHEPFSINSAHRLISIHLITNK